MTTILTQPEPLAVGEPPRLLSIGVNLLPPEITDSRRARKVRRRVLVALAGFTVLLAGWYSVVSYQAVDARSELTSAQEDIDALSKQQSQFGDLVRTQSESRLIEAQLSGLFAKDLKWRDLLTAVQPGTATGVRLTGVTAELPTDNGAAKTGAGETTLPSTTQQALVGKLTITGVAAGKKAVADYVDALGTVKQVGNPLLSDAVPQDGRVAFTVRLDITADALSHRYAVDNSSRTGGK
jgi:Tfp pilus assembly protein PilN